MKGFIKTIIPILLSSLIYALKNESNKIQFNSLFSSSTVDNSMQFYSMKLQDNPNQMDLLVDSKILNSKSIYESPIVLVSTEPLPNSNKSKQWVCGQLGLETCLIPSNKIQGIQTIYFGVACNKCKFTLLAYFVNEPILKDGESQLFHLKAGDKVIFKLDEFFNAEKNEILIKSFNMRMTPYKMAVEIIDKNQPEKVINVPTSENWIGGQQAIIKPDAEFTFKNYYYKIIFTAEKDGVFNIEARSSQASIKLTDKILKFDSVKNDIKNCYAYSIPNDRTEEELIFEIKSIKGKIEYSIFAEINDNKKNQENNNSITLQGEVMDKNYSKIILTSADRKNNTQGSWKICLNSGEKSSLYTLQAYLASNHEHIKEYQKLLFTLLKNEEMYEVQNLQLHEKKGIPIMRLLQESMKTTSEKPIQISKAKVDGIDTEFIGTDSNVNPEPQTPAKINTEIETETPIHINGSGVSGIAVSFIFFIAVFIGIYIMMAIFVNTKTIDEPLKMGRIEH